jgi:hypothetical protein
MLREVHPVQGHEGPRRLGATDQLGRRRDRADGVGRECERDEPGAIGQLLVERLQVERDVVVADVDPPDRRAGVARGEDPRTNVRVVIEPGDDDLVAGAKGARERP